MTKIKKIHITEFGKFKNFDMSFTSGFNEIKEANGFGKTTVAAFIKAMFFGLDGSGKKSVNDNARKKYTPYECDGKFGGSLEMVHNGKTYIITRFFGKTPASDEFILTDGAGVPCDDYGKDIGEKLFDISASGFERCLYIPQSGIEVLREESIKSKLHRLVEDAEEGGGYDAAVERLKEHVNSLTGTRQTKNLSVKAKAEQQRHVAREDLNAANEAARSAEEARKEMRSNNEEKQKLDKELKQLKEKQRQNDREAGQREAAIADAKKRLAELLEEKRSLEGRCANASDEYIKSLVEKNKEAESIKTKAEVLKDVAPEQKSSETSRGKKSWIIPLFVSIIVLIGAACLGVFWNDIDLTFKVGGIIILLLLLVCAVIVSCKNSKNNNTLLKQKQSEVDYLFKQYEVLRAEIAESFKRSGITLNDFSEALSELQGMRSRYRDVLSKYDELSAAASKLTAVGASEKERTAEDIASLDKRVAELSQHAGALQEKLKVLEEKADKRKDAEAAIASCDEVIKDAERRAKLAEKTKELLDVAKNSLANAFMPGIKKSFSKYISVITDKKYTQAAITDELDIILTEDGSGRDFGFFSRGTKDLALFCLRLALIDVMYENGLPFLLLDDPFVNADEDNFSRAMAVIKKHAAKSQVIYFTCRA